MASQNLIADDMQYPLAVAATEKEIFVADRNLPGIWRYADGKLEIYFQGSKKFKTPLNAVRCLAIDHEGKLLAGDSATREVFRFDDNKQPQPLTQGWVGIPMALAVAADGSIFASDIEIQRIVKIPAAGGKPEIITELAAVRGLTITPDEKLLAVSHSKEAVVKLSLDGKEREVLITGRPFEFSHHVTYATDGAPYVIDGYAKKLWKIEGDKATAVFTGEPLLNPVGLCRQGDHLIIADPHRKSLYRMTKEKQLELIVGPTAK